MMAFTPAYVDFKTKYEREMSKEDIKKSRGIYNQGEEKKKKYALSMEGEDENPNYVL